ncbi:hypothetical protein SteCoe_36566 [Stentor coeruleus]|uniref:Uncharacterized protein n=1 Tax=Stentor coeruleus TaxID=5963 RepID=A0A1R2APX8_9CILI|nr:hypothetical protein SteCoe_36566 [Stentor coeruleus]
MDSRRKRKRLNSSSMTTCDPLNQSFPLNCFYSPQGRDIDRIPKNSPRNSGNLEMLRSVASVPGLVIPKELSPKYLEEIDRFRQQKIREYKETLELCLNASAPSPYVVCKREKLKIMNQKAEIKRKEIMKKREEDEIKRLKQSQSLKLSSIYYKISQRNERKQKEKAFREKLEKKKVHKEQERKESLTKNLVLDNIKNFYTDRISELKEKIRYEKMQNDIIRYEQKQRIFEMKKESKQLKK